MHYSQVHEWRRQHFSLECESRRHHAGPAAHHDVAAKGGQLCECLRCTERASVNRAGEERGAHKEHAGADAEALRRYRLGRFHGLAEGEGSKSGHAVHQLVVRPGPKRVTLFIGLAAEAVCANRTGEYASEAENAAVNERTVDHCFSLIFFSLFLF